MGLAACPGLLCTGVKGQHVAVFPESICGDVPDENGATAAFTGVLALTLGPHSLAVVGLKTLTGTGHLDVGGEPDGLAMAVRL